MVLLDDNPHGAPPPAPASTARFGPPTARCACAAAYCPAPAGPVRVRPARARGAIVPLARATDPATRSDLLPYAAHHVYGIFAIKVQSNYLDRRPRPGNQLRYGLGLTHRMDWSRLLRWQPGRYTRHAVSTLPCFSPKAKRPRGRHTGRCFSALSAPSVSWLSKSYRPSWKLRLRWGGPKCARPTYPAAHGPFSRLSRVAWG